MTKIWIARSEDDPDVIATWRLFELDQGGYEALRDDPEWMSAEVGRVERMSEFETEVRASGTRQLRVAREARRCGSLTAWVLAAPERPIADRHQAEARDRAAAPGFDRRCEPRRDRVGPRAHSGADV